MTRNLTLKKVIHRLFLSGVLFSLLAPLRASAFDWPFNTDEFQKKLTSRDLAASVQYYARGPGYEPGQLWNEAEFKRQLAKQNYRLRDSDQLLLAGDAKMTNLDECRRLTQLPDLGDLQKCWIWQTHYGGAYAVLTKQEPNQEPLVQMVYSSDKAQGTFQETWRASLDPVLVAQFKNNRPVLQYETHLADIPVNCLNAVMAIEDSDFLNHSGVSYLGLTRSLIKNIIQRRYAQGGSTITQQLVKNYFLTPEKTISRKLKELYLAVKLESEWTKDQILETYLNIIYMGQSGAFQVSGFGAASQYYFNKPISQLDLPECALIAAIVNNPGTYNPTRHPNKALSRRKLVLSKMNELNLITQDEMNKALDSKLPQPKALQASETAPYFIEAVRQQLQGLNMKEESDGTSLKIYTSLDLEQQQAAQSALQEHINALEKNRKNLVKNREKGFRLEGVVIAGESHTGLINAFVGGQNYRLTQFNRALNAKRQIGSLVKPFVYLTALSQGMTPLTEVEDSPFVWKYGNQKWAPENYEKSFGGIMPMYNALKESLNVPTARLAQKIGIENIVNTAHQMGLSSSMDLTPATSLGASTHYPLEIVDGYRTISNFGDYSPSSFIEKIIDSQDHVVYNFSPKSESRFDKDTVAVLVGMMKETIRSGTAKASSALGWTRPSAGKTGTTSDNHDAWFAGFTPFQTAVVWLGYDQSLSSRLTGASGAVPVWVNFMKSASTSWPPSDFDFPAGVEKRDVNLFDTDKKTELIFRK